MFQNWEFLIVEIWVHLLIAVVLTLILSWAIWGFRARSERTQLVTMREDLKKATRTLETKESDLSLAFSKQEQLKDRISAIQTKLTEQVAAQKKVEETAAADRAKLADAIKSRDGVQKELTLTREKLAVLQKKASEPVAENLDSQGKLVYLKERLKRDVDGASAWTKKSVAYLLGKSDS